MLAGDQLEDVHRARTAQLEREAREDLHRRLLGELDAIDCEAQAAPRPLRRGRRRPCGALPAALERGERYVALLAEAQRHGVDIDALSANRRTPRPR